MYKKFSLNELATIQNNFIPHLYKIIQQERCEGVNQFFKFALKEGEKLYYFERNAISFIISLEGSMIHLIDEIEKIEVEIPMDQKGGLNDLVKKYLMKNQRQVWQRSIEQILMDEFTQGGFRKLLGKPYLVYDIETSLIPDDQNLKNVEFYVGYSMEETENGKMKYHCIMPEDVPAFVERMLNFDGYIVGFNQIYFDNPVSVYNADRNNGLSCSVSDAIQQLNEKSIDLYVFIQQLTGKRIGLNKISGDLLGLSKNLEGWGASVEGLWKEWKTTENEKMLNQIKEYCKNDVRMTALLFMYLLYFGKVYMDGEEYNYDVAKFLQYAQIRKKKADLDKARTQSLL